MGGREAKPLGPLYAAYPAVGASGIGAGGQDAAFQAARGAAREPDTRRGEAPTLGSPTAMNILNVLDRRDIHGYLRACNSRGDLMTAAQARRPTSQSAAKMASPAAADLISMFAQRNPKSSRGDLTEVGKLVAEFSVTAANLSPAARKRLIARKERFKKLIVEIAAEPEAAAQPLKLIAKAAAEVSHGAGLGRVLSPEAGKARIAEYATPTKVEDWAGPLAGPTELERDFGVARSTLHTWQKQGAVIGLLVGVRKHAFPTEQFVDGRPVTGLAAIVAAIRDPRAAWLWLREPNPGFAGVTPLTRLKAGATDKVVEMARSNFADA